MALRHRARDTGGCSEREAHDVSTGRCGEDGQDGAEAQRNRPADHHRPCQRQGIRRFLCGCGDDVVVICASTIESVRLLLNSACAKHPNGLGNSSGLLGRYFMDQIPCLVFGSVPGSDGFELVDGTSPANNHGGMYMPRFQNLDRRDYPAFARGFNIQGVAGRAPVP